MQADEHVDSVFDGLILSVMAAILLSKIVLQIFA